MTVSALFANGLQLLSSVSKYGRRHETENAILTHSSRDKMTDISQTTFPKRIFFNENVWISIKISLNFFLLRVQLTIF